MPSPVQLRWCLCQILEQRDAARTPYLMVLAALFGDRQPKGPITIEVLYDALDQLAREQSRGSWAEQRYQGVTEVILVACPDRRRRRSAVAVGFYERRADERERLNALMRRHAQVRALMREDKRRDQPPPR